MEHHKLHSTENVLMSIYNNVVFSFTLKTFEEFRDTASTVYIYIYHSRILSLPVDLIIAILYTVQNNDIARFNVKLFI